MFRSLFFILPFLAAILAGCSRELVVKNLSDYQVDSYGNRYGPAAGLKIGIVSSEDRESRALASATARSLAKSGIVASYPYDPACGAVDRIVDLSVWSAHEGSLWNLPIAFPGYLIFAPCWHGYHYTVRYDVTVSSRGGRQEVIPVSLDIRHSEPDRTWIEVGWLGWPIIPLGGGVYSITYDTDVTPRLLTSAGPTIGDLVAEKIVAGLVLEKK